MTDFITISRKNFVQLIGKGSSYNPNPDDPGDPGNPFGPFGPGGPILRRIVELQRLRAGELVALNPQPLPPIDKFNAAITQIVIDHVAQTHAFANMLSGATADDVRNGSVNLLAEFADWCGTMTRWQILEALLRRIFGKHPLPPPPPEPWWDKQFDATDLITIGVQMERAFDQIADERLAVPVNEIGSKLTDRGLEMLG